MKPENLEDAQLLLHRLKHYRALREALARCNFHVSSFGLQIVDDNLPPKSLARIAAVIDEEMQEHIAGIAAELRGLGVDTSELTAPGQRRLSVVRQRG